MRYKMSTFLKRIFTVASAILLYAGLAFSVFADDKIDWEILVDANQPGTFYANTGTVISTDLFAPFVPGSTYWLKGNLYPKGSVDPNNYQVNANKKIGEWYCTGTRVRNVLPNNQNIPVAAPGELYEEAYFTFRLNNGDVIYTKQQAFFQKPGRAIVIFSNVKGVKTGDIFGTNPNDVNFSPPYILVKNLKLVK